MHTRSMNTQNTPTIILELDWYDRKQCDRDDLGDPEAVWLMPEGAYDSDGLFDSSGLQDITGAQWSEVDVLAISWSQAKNLDNYYDYTCTIELPASAVKLPVARG